MHIADSQCQPRELRRRRGGSRAISPTHFSCGSSVGRVVGLPILWKVGGYQGLAAGGEERIRVHWKARATLVRRVTSAIFRLRVVSPMGHKDNVLTNDGAIRDAMLWFAQHYCSTVKGRLVDLACVDGVSSNLVTCKFTCSEPLAIEYARALASSACRSRAQSTSRQVTAWKASCVKLFERYGQQVRTTTGELPLPLMDGWSLSFPELVSQNSASSFLGSSFAAV